MSLPLGTISRDRSAGLDHTTLIIIAFSTVFYSRIFCAVTGAPSILNLAHFAVVPLVSWLIFTAPSSPKRSQPAIAPALTSGIISLGILILLSAAWNSAGLINAIVDFMMLGEPFIFLLAIVWVPMSVKSVNRLRSWLIGSATINFLLAAAQKPLIDLGYIQAGEFNGTDGCGGVFFVSGAGNYVSASVSAAVALYIISRQKLFPLWTRLAAGLAAFWQLLFSDSKQLLLAYLAAWLLLIALSLKDIGKTIRLLGSATVFILVFLWCIENVEVFKPFTAWARPELYGINGLAWYAKFYGVRLIYSNYGLPLDWLFGLGPGHTISRLGAWFLRDYWSLLGPLGATTHPISEQVMAFTKTNWLVYSSSLFNPIFGWAGIWGDLGIFGLGAYLYIDYLVWRYCGFIDGIKITMLAVFVMGFIFTQMEEPGYMLSIASLVGLQSQEVLSKRKNHKSPSSS